MSQPAGWYPDPADPSRKRYWDGTRWTDAYNPPLQTVVPPVTVAQGPRRVWPWVLAAVVVGFAAIAVAFPGDDDDEGGGSGEDHPYLEKLEKNAPPVVEVGDFQRCQKQVGSWVFFNVHHEPFTARNREIVDGYCKVADPDDHVEVVGEAALDEIQAP